MRKAREALQHLLDGFAQRDDPGDLWVEGSTVVGVERSALPVPGLVLLLLTKVMGMVNHGIHEKTAWYVPLAFRGHRVTIALQKFGMRLYVISAKGSDESAEEIGKEVIRRLQKAVRILEREVLSEYSVSQIAEGRLTIANHSGRQRAMCEHFRETAVAAFRSADQPPEMPADVKAEGIFAGIGEKIHESQVGAWNAIATVNAYFSVLEHELVLASAFADFDPTEGALEELIGDRWSEKFRKLFDVTDPDTKRVHDQLHEVAETYRNPYSHGGFDKQGAALWFHLEDFGAVPARLSDIRSSPHFELFPIQPESFEEICKLMDDTDQWLRSGRYAGAFEWIDAGLDVAYDPESRDEYRKVMDDAEARQKLIARRSDEYDRAANMDW